ncbi:MAG TPA: methyltransferase [Polyangiaceae bacterium]|nr:methyltransferase [Polyangiaceae bacterium]
MQPCGRALEGAWASAARLLEGAHDLVLARAEGGEAPAWCVARGWEPFLRGLSDDDTAAAEREGLSALSRVAGAPPSLLAFAREVERVVAVGPLSPADLGPALAPLPPSDLPLGVRGRRASDRKWAQVVAFAAACAPLARACSRVVDVGSGHGHLTRHLAEAFGRPALGLERDAARVAVATALSRPASGAATPSRPAGGAATFVTADLFREGLAIGAGDLVVGLHACGDLGDLALDAASRAGAPLALVSCCLQKTRAAARLPRESPAGVDPARLVWPREVLGLSNLAQRAEGVEASLEQNLRARQNRCALAWLLRERGLSIGRGEELAGVNRRRAHAPLDEFAGFALARRGLAPPTAAELARAAEAGAASYARARRYELPRNALGRVLEVFVLYDRARALGARGYAVAAGVLFSDAWSPRNLALLAAPA